MVSRRVGAGSRGELEAESWVRGLRYDGKGGGCLLPAACCCGQVLALCWRGRSLASRSAQAPALLLCGLHVPPGLPPYLPAC